MYVCVDSLWTFPDISCPSLPVASCVMGCVRWRQLGALCAPFLLYCKAHKGTNSKARHGTGKQQRWAKQGRRKVKIRLVSPAVYPPFCIRHGMSVLLIGIPSLFGIFARTGCICFAPIYIYSSFFILGCILCCSSS